MFEVKHEEGGWDFGLDDGEGEQVALGLEASFGATADGLAADKGAWDLGDLPDVEVGFGMGGAIGGDAAGDLFGGHEAEVGDPVVVDETGEEEVDHLGGEVGAVGLFEVVEVAVGTGVDGVDEALVLLGGGVDLVGPKAAVVGDAGGLPPLFHEFAAFGAVRDEIAEKAVAVGLALVPDELGGGVGEDVFEGVGGVEELEHGGGDPVELADGVVAGEDYALRFAGMAHAEVEGAIGADAVEIDGGVTDGHHGPEGAEGFADEDGEVGTKIWDRHQQEDEEPQRLSRQPIQTCTPLVQTCVPPPPQTGSL